MPERVVSHSATTVALRRRTLLCLGFQYQRPLTLWPDTRLLAQQISNFVVGPPVPDVAPVQLSAHVWSIVAKDAFVSRGQPRHDVQHQFCGV